MAFIEHDGTFDPLKIRRLRHQLAAHPLMTAPRLAELALRIDPDYVRFHDGERRLGTDMSALMRSDPERRRLRKAIDNLHQASAFVQILNLRSDPAYRAVVDALLDEVLPLLPPRDRRLVNRDAAAFLASPGSTTPFHLDHEQNFLCHLQGAKTLYVWDHRDRSVVSEAALECFFHEGRLRGASYQAEMLPKAQAFALTPGDCVYMPMGSPHAVSTGGDITVTVSFLLNTQSSFETVEVYRANCVMRRLGLSPTPVGDRPVWDALKLRTLGAARRVRNLARGHSAEPHLQWY
jgi:Cupin-like domain